MLFASYPFLFFFLPVLLLCTGLVAPFGASRLCCVLLLFSLLFYAVQDVYFLFVLSCLFGLNYAFGLGLTQEDRVGGFSYINRSSRKRKFLLFLAILLNIGLLCWYKYVATALPPGLSFCVFIQLAWLISVYHRQNAPEGLMRHALFSFFFPYVLSGPIVRYEQMGAQFDALRGPEADGLASGLALFSLGLAKKVLLADGLAPYANAVFSAAEKAWPISSAEAWLGSLCYSFQLYFDFSGYTDMALGIGLMLGLRLPENFASPYKSTGIVEFWRRWHITLGTWLRDFLYIPLGGNRSGRIRQYCNLVLTMLIGGIWHGAGWTYLVWGALHGVLLSCNHFFRTLLKGTHAEKICKTWPLRVLFIALTFFCLDLCWVVFRSANLASAWQMLKIMFTGPVYFSGVEGTVSGFLPHGYFQSWMDFILPVVSILIIWGLPNSSEIVQSSGERQRTWWQFKKTKSWGIVLALLTFASLLLLSRQSTFLYFQF